MAIFISDNVTGVCKEVMEAMQKANTGSVSSYGNDKWSINLKKKILKEEHNLYIKVLSNLEKEINDKI